MKIMETENNKNLEEFEKEVKKEDLVPLGWEIIKSDKLLKMELPKTDFLIENLIPSAGITILSGNPGCGKSWLMLEIAKCVGSGYQLFADDTITPTPDSINRFKTKNVNVLYIDEESALSEIKRRWTMLEPPIITLVDFMSLQGLKIDDSEKRKALLDLIDYRSYGFIIFDSLRDLHSKNENDSKESQELIDYFREITRKGVTVLISHHNRKESFMNSKDASQTLRGSTAILGGLDCLLSVENPKSTNGVKELIINQPKLRQGKSISPFKVMLVEQDEKIKIEYVGAIEEEATKLQKTKEAILKLLEEGEKNPKTIIQTLIPLYFAEKTIKKSITELKDAKIIQPRKDGKYVYYSLVP
jgi:archaellum biogenesis ATPase FlaH